MINQSFYSSIPTKLDLNGPYMSFTTIPEGISGDPGDTVNLVGIATAEFIGAGATTVNDGIVLYRWYEVGVGALSDGNRLSGTSTNTLTISNLQSPGDSSRRFYLEAKYQSTAYKNRLDGKNGNHITPAVSDPAAAEVSRPRPTASITASSTSIAYNGSVTISWSTTNADTLTSNFGDTRLSGSRTFTNQTSSRTFRITATNSTGSVNASVGVNVAAPPTPTPTPTPTPPPSPEIVISSQPTSQSATFNKCSGGGGSVNFSVSAFVNNPTGGTLSYQWYRNEIALFNSADVSGAQSSTLTLKVLESQKGGSLIRASVSYPGAINNNTPSNTANYTVTVIEPRPSLSITSQPTNQTVFVDETATFTVGASISDGRPVSYQWYFSNGNIIAGETSSSLSITPTSAGTQSFYVIVSDSQTTCTAVPSSIQSDIVTLTANEQQKIIRVARRGDLDTSISYSDINLSTFDFNSNGDWEFYSPFEDLQVDVLMRGGAGPSKSGNSGGQGGLSIVRLTLRQNTEYIIRSFTSTENGGGGSTVLYEKARLLAVVGGGGGAGTNGSGGNGGGVGLSGQSGSGSSGGTGGGTSPGNPGYFSGGSVYDVQNTFTTGGRISICTLGSFDGNWYEIDPCSDYGGRPGDERPIRPTVAYNARGQLVNGSATLSRGFKGGVGHRNNGGFAQTSNEGAGGYGTFGGSAGATSTRSGGGGGGGYAGGVSIVDRRTGGNTGSAQFTIALPGRLRL